MTNLNIHFSHEMNENKLEEQKIRDLAMLSIIKMDAREFQTRLLNGTLPDFQPAKEGDQDFPIGLQRDTCHSHHILSEEDFIKGITDNYAEVHRKKLRYMSKTDFIQIAYYEFINISFDN